MPPPTPAQPVRQAAPPAEQKNLYEAIGGAAAVVAMVEQFYQRVLADAELKDFFADVPMDRLLRMQCEFFSAALGGPELYKGRVIAHAHQRLAIERRHFQRFVDHLFETLAGFAPSEQDRYEIIARINLYSEDVIGAGADFGD